VLESYCDKEERDGNDKRGEEDCKPWFTCERELFFDTRCTKGTAAVHALFKTILDAVKTGAARGAVDPSAIETFFCTVHFAIRTAKARSAKWSSTIYSFFKTILDAVTTRTARSADAATIDTGFVLIAYTVKTVWGVAARTNLNIDIIS
jgi:hypothetical protein